jgi:two-component system response regulator HydG
MKSALILSPQSDAISSISSSIPSDCQVEIAEDIRGARKLNQKYQFDIIFLDLKVIRDDFSDLIFHFRESNPFVSIVVLSTKAAIRKAVEMVKAGANDYLTCPVDAEEVRLVIDSLKESLTQNLELDYLRDQFWKTEWLEVIQTRSDNMREVYKKIGAVAPTKVTVLLSGETGTGKGMLARLLHHHSNRCEEPFVTVHCGAIPDTLLESELFGHEKGAFTGAVRMKIGKFEMARHGTIFLDEIGTITPAAQVKLLQILQDGTFNRVGGEMELKTNARVIAASNSNLAEMSDGGTFRKDLYYRLNVFPINLPALKERKKDIAYLADQFIKRLNAVHSKNIQGIHPHASKALQNYDWPGNIRELENLMERAYILESTSILTPENFPTELFDSDKISAVLSVSAHLPLAEARKMAIDDFERQYLKELLSRSKGRVNLAAAEGGISTRQLNKLMVKHGIRKEAFKN